MYPVLAIHVKPTVPHLREHAVLRYDVNTINMGNFRTVSLEIRSQYY